MSQYSLLGSLSRSQLRSGTKSLSQIDKSKLNPLTKLQIITFVSYCLSLFSIGLQAASFGPILSDLKQQTNVNLATISTIFSAFALGQVFGAILTGFILKIYNENEDNPQKYFKHITPHNLMGVCMIITGISYLIIPFIHSIYFMDFIMAFGGVTFGVQATGSNFLIFAIFNVTKDNIAEEKRCNTYNNLMQAAFALGGFVTPIIIQLSFKWFYHYQPSFILFAVVLFFPSAYLFIRIETPRKFQPQITVDEDEMRKLNVNYGSITGDNIDTKAISRKIKCLEVLYYAFCGTFIFMYIGSEYSFGFYITTYGLDHLLLSASMSRLLSSAYWLGLLFGRLLAVPIALCLTSLSIIIKDLLGVLGACIILYVCSGHLFIGNNNGLIVAFVASVMYGLFLASIYAANYSFANQALTKGIDSFFVSLMLLLTGAATFVIPLLTGYSMSSFGTMSFNTVIILCALCMILFFFLCWLDAKRLWILQRKRVLFDLI